MAESTDPVLVQKLNEIFFPHFWEKRTSLKESNRKLVHYTSAQNALRIITEKTMMLRSTVCMNDYSEVQHGHKLVQSCFFENDNDLLNQFVAAFDEISAGVANEAFHLYDHHFTNNVYRTYVACISEHYLDEDETGRLSMWRAYSQGSTGVAIVLDKSPLFGNAAFVGFFASPVAYLRDREIRHYLEQVIRSAREQQEFLKSIPRETILNSIFTLLLFSAICIKHHGFEEEREWRVIYLPGIFPSENLKQSSVTIRGVPQITYKLPLADIPEKSLVGIEIPQFVDSIIIGPTAFPYPICEVLADALAKAGVAEPGKRIRISNIPLRT
jgi:Protein of unknown function (DUF2971)